MLKLLLAITFLCFTAFVHAQKTYQFLQKLDSLNRLNSAIALEPKNAQLRAERINIINTNDSAFEQLANSNNAMLLEDLDFLITLDKPILYKEEQLDKAYFLKSKIELLKQLNTDEQTLEEAYIDLLDFFKVQDKEDIDYSYLFIFKDIIKYFTDKALAQEDTIHKIAYLDKALGAIAIFFPIQELENFNINNPISIKNIEKYFFEASNILSYYPKKDRQLNLLKKYIAYTYVSVLNNIDNSYAQGLDYLNILEKALAIAEVYYAEKDYHNAYHWATAFFKDREMLIKQNKIQAYDIDRVTYYFYPYQMLYNYNTLQPNTDFDIILDNIVNMINTVKYTPYMDTLYFNNIFQKYEQEGSNNGKYYFAKALFKYNNRINNFATYKTYGKDIIPLLDKAKHLGYKHPEMDNILSTIYLTFESDKAKAAIYEKKYKAYKNKTTHKKDLKQTAHTEQNDNLQLSILQLINK